MRTMFALCVAVCSFTLYSAITASVIYAQQANPDAIRQCGENLRTTAYNYILINYDFNLTENQRTQWCRAYSEWRNDRSNYDEAFRYGDGIGGSLSLSRERAEAFYELECFDGRSNRTVDETVVNSVRSLDPMAVDAYQTCLALAQGGTSLSVENLSATRLGLDITAYEENTIRRVDVIGLENSDCGGSLADMQSNYQLDSGESLGMICMRQPGEGGSLREATIQVEVEGQDRWRYHWAGRGPCGSLNQRSCNGTSPVPYPETFPEEGNADYDIARALRASSSAASLANMASGSVPRSCSDDEAEATQDHLRGELEAKWSAVRVSHTRGHSCTKGSSGGKKDCRCVRTLQAPNGFTQSDLSVSGTGNREVGWAGTRGEVCMWKHGKGRDELAVTAEWRLSEPEKNARVNTDLAYVMSLSSCFNGCNPGLAPDDFGICR